MKERLFQWIAASFPTHKMDENKSLATLWRILFYALRPRAPFVMRTRHYKLYAHPQKGTLTRAVIRRGLWEQLETKAFLKLLTPGAFVVDGGANFGHYALTAANVVGPDGLVMAFEPHPDVFELLKANQSLSQGGNLVPVQAGLGAEEATLDIFTDSANPGGHSFHSWNLRGEDGASHPVPVHTLDAYLASFAPNRKVDVIKIDVQGFEMDVLKGAAGIIGRDHPAVLCEVTPQALEKAGSGTEDLFGFFEQQGYTATVLLPEKNHEQAMTYPELKKFFKQSNAEYHDVLFLPAPVSTPPRNQ